MEASAVPIDTGPPSRRQPLTAASLCAAEAEAAARLRQVLEFQDGPTIVVGHSCGGRIMAAPAR